MISIEKLVHFQCEKTDCKKWWTIGDAPIETKKYWFCPWCGTKQDLTDKRVLQKIGVE